MERVFNHNLDKDLTTVIKVLKDEALKMFAEDIATNQAIGDFGQELISKPSKVMTICNAGALATCGYGTALGVIRSAANQNKIKRCVGM